MLELSRAFVSSLVRNGQIPPERAEIAHSRLLKLIESVSWQPAFVSDEIAQFSSFVPKSKQRYLDRHFMSWVSRIPSLRKLSYELHRVGKSRLGDVIQMTRAELLAQTSATPKTVQTLEEDLEQIGLQLGMKAPTWSSASQAVA